MNRLALSLLMMSMVGCASTSLLREPGKLVGLNKGQQNVARILCLWEPSHGNNVEGKPARGFAGQILFFGGKDDAAVRVDGQVRVVEYDNYSVDDDEPKPLHAFTFEPDAWDVHRTEGSLGQSYSVFIPYMQKHKDTVNCGLKVEFTNKDGRVVSSDITEVMLPGHTSIASTSSFRRSVTRTASRRAGEAEAAKESSKKDQLETTTIALPRK